MPLQHDSRGFLTGDVINDIRRAVDTLKDIKQNLSDIKTRLMSMRLPEPVIPRRNRSEVNIGPLLQGGRIEPVVPRRRDAQGRFVSDSAGPGNSTGNQESRNSVLADLIAPAGDIALPNAGGRRSNRQEQLSERDSRGRFTSNNDQSERQFQRTLFNGIGDRIATAMVDAESGLEKADPTIQAFNEIATPLRNGYQIFMGDSKDDSRWFRRIFSEIRLFRRDDTVFNRAANRSLRNLENREDENGNGGGESFLGGLFGSITPWIMRALAGLGPMLLTGVTAVLGTVFGPIGLAISAAGLAAWALFSEDGQKFFARIGDDFMTGWNAITENIKTSWDSAVKVFTDVWEPIKQWFDDKLGIVSDTFNKAGNTVNTAVKNFTGIDVKETAKSAYGKASDFTKRNVIEPLATAKDWVLGQTSKWFESGKGGAGTVSTGKGDKGGASYGTYQLSSKEGTLQNFLKSTKYGATFGGLAPGSKEFNERWKQVAKMDPDFEKSQHDFIKATHYDPQVRKLKDAGIDVSNRGSAIHDAIWSTSVQFGGDTGLIVNALKGKDANKISEAEFVSAIQDYKMANNNQLFKSSSPRARAGTLSRAAQEKELLLGLSSVSSRLPVQTAQVASVTMPSPKVPTMLPPPPVADAPELREPLGSGFDDRYVSLNIPNNEVSQDVSDRKIAHVVTGGYSAPV